MPAAVVRTHYRPAEVAKQLGVAKTTVGRWITSGSLPHVRPSAGVILIAPEDLTAFLERHREGNDLPPRRRRR